MSRAPLHGCAGSSVARSNDVTGDIVIKDSGDLLQIAAATNGSASDLATTWADAVDITSVFLASGNSVQLGPALKETVISMYKGTIHRIMAGNDDENVKVGILAGKDNVVQDVILAESMDYILQSHETKSRWEQRGFVPVGLIAFTEGECAQNFADSLRKFETSSDTLLLLLKASTLPCKVFEYDVKEKTFCAASLTMKSRRCKDEKFVVVHCDELNVTMKDKAQCMVSNIIVKHLSAAITGIPKKEDHVFMKSKTPPDGLCLYHAILGALQPAAHTSVPRAQLGFARNPRQQRAESDAARQLELMAFGENKHDPAVDLQDLALVGERLQLAIRCTVADEVAKHFADAGEHMLQDAVHGIDRYPPDVHVYYSWHTNPDSGINTAATNVFCNAKGATSTMQLARYYHYLSKCLSLHLLPL